MLKKSTKSKQLSAAQTTRRRLICSLLPSLAVAWGALPKSRKVCTVAELIEAMGGADATAEWAGVDRWRIDEWRDRGIPTGWHYRLDRALGARGFEIDPVRLGFTAGSWA